MADIILHTYAGFIIKNFLVFLFMSLDRLLEKKTTLLLRAVNKAQRLFIRDEFTAESLFGNLLETLIDLTKSEYGFIGKIIYTEDGNPYLKTLAISNMAWNRATQRFCEENISQEFEFQNLNNLFGYAIITGEPVISNDPLNDLRKVGLPEGHPPLFSFLGVPFKSKDQMVGMFGIANRPGGYNHKIIDFLEPFISTCTVVFQGLDHIDKQHQAFVHNQKLLKQEKLLTERLDNKRKLLQESLSNALDLKEQLNQNEAKLRLVLDHINQAVVHFDLEFNIITYNRKCYEYVRYFTGENIPSSLKVIDYIPKENVRNFYNQVERCIKNKKIVRSEGMVEILNNRHFLFISEYIPIVDDKGCVSSILLTTADITSLRKTEQDSQNAKKALNTSALISITDRRGVIMEANEAFCEASKYFEEELIGQKHNIINSGYHPEDFFTDMWKTIGQGKCWRGEIKNRAKDGTFFWVDTTINPVLDERGKIIQYLSVKYLITERKALEEDREKMLSDLTKYAFMTAHNLRGPLARVLGLTALFDNTQVQNEFNANIIENLKVAAKEMDDVVHSMNTLLNKHTNGHA